MAEIFAPGSIAGPPITFMGAYSAGTTYTTGQAVSSAGASYISLVNSNTGNTPAASPAQWGLLAAAGAAGTAGAAGSSGSVTSLASSTLPSFLGQNLFDFSKITTGLAPSAADGTLISAGGGATNCTALIYCPGATSMVSDLSVDAGNWGPEGICLYDANGGFISAIPTSEFTGHVVNGETVIGGTAWTLPGTQVYVRFGYVAAWLSGNSNNWTQSESLGRIYATISGAATLPGSYAAAGLATTEAVNTGIATALSNLTPMLSAFGPSVSSGLAGINTRNMFDYTKATLNMFLNADGTPNTTGAASGWQTSGLVFAPGATSFITNIPIAPAIYANNPHVLLYDANGNFIGDYSGTLAALPTQDGLLKSNYSYPLPGTQTYVRFSYNSGFGSYGWPPAIQQCVFYSGTTAAPPPALTTLNSYVPFGANAPVSVKTATQLGCSASYDDCSGILNAFLATASSSNPVKLILDGMFNVSTGLVISTNGYTMIEGLGAGTGINVSGYYDGVRIGTYTAATLDSEGTYNITPPARSAVNIVLRDFTVNATGQVNAAADQPVTGAIAHGTYPIILANCSNVVCDNLNFPHYGANYCITLANCDHARVTNCTFDTTGYTHDGVHIDGPANDVGIDNCDFTTGDDAIALNAPEGYGGDISRVTITNCRFYNALSVMRIYTSLPTSVIPTNNVHKVRDVVVSNCTGYITNICFVLGIEGGGITSTSDVDQIQDLSISNCTLSAPVNLVRVRDNMGSITLNGVKFIPTSTNPVIDVGGSTYSVGDLSLTDFTLLRNPDGNTVVDVIAVSSGVTIDKLSLIHCRVTDEEGSSYTPISSWVNNGGTVSNLRLEAVDMTHAANLTAGASWTGFTAVKGAGVLGTGVQVPDANMDNNALYLSSTASGAPSIKIGGTAKRLTLT